MHKSFANIGGRSLAYEVKGEGKPTVILETGLQAESDAWETVFGTVSQFTRVLRYDRAGRGHSDAGPLPRTAINTAEDLYQLLKVLEISEPCLLVGQSFGSMVIRAFTHFHAEQTCGVILVDPTHEAQFQIISKALPPITANTPENIRKMHWFWKEGFKSPKNNQEQIDFPTSCTQIQAFQCMGDIPLIVLSGGESMQGFAEDRETQEQLQALQFKLHEQLSGLSSHSKHVVVDGCGHFVQKDRPEAIIQAIQEISQGFIEDPQS